MLPKILPAPYYWTIPVYFVPSAIMAVGVYLRWKRIPSFPPELQEQAKRSTFWFAWLAGFLTLLVMGMIKLPV